MEDYFYLGTDDPVEVYDIEPSTNTDSPNNQIEESEQILTKEERKEIIKKTDPESYEMIYGDKAVQKLGSLDQTPQIQKFPANVELGGGADKIAKEIKIERTTEVIASMSDVITIPNSFGELTTYIAQRQIEDGPVIYWSEAYRTELEHKVFERLRDPKIISKAKCRLPATDNNINMVANTLLHATYQSLGMGRRKTILLSSKYINDKGREIEATYYDMQKGEMVEYSDLEDSLKEKCFSKFCNTTSEVLHVPVIPEEEINLSLIQEYADKAYSDLEAWHKANDTGESTAGIYQNRFDDTFMVWACGDEGLYRDILTMCATPLMVRKPECTFFILGNRSNGKSSLRHLMQCAYGVRNCASVQVAQMGSWDYASLLLGKVVNFPDEEKTNLEDMDIAAFKSMSTHENLQIRKKGSSVPFDIVCDFVSIIPINAYPNWKALDEGVSRRVRILPFNADLSNESNKGGKGFEETHYTPEFVSKFIGEIIGIASFYTRTGRDIVWSETTENASSDWKKEKVNAPIFKQDFEKVFKGFQSHALLYECYQNWCKGGLGNIDTGIDYQYETKKRLKEVFTQFGGYNKNTNIRTMNGSVHITKSDQPCPIEWCLWEGATIDLGHIGGLDWGTKMGVKTVREILDMGADPVTLKLMEQGLAREDDSDE